MVVGSDVSVTGIDVHVGLGVSVTNYDALVESDAFVIGADMFHADRELQKVVDDIFNPPLSLCLCAIILLLLLAFHGSLCRL